eukprot:TRINITY_DN14768_c0_g1_i2.p1 TRINITY_DN14768_c0_g1~~TRINITY_DN14768_c0_g1_i2.p1  ORF type:complete len:194 (+),score=33.32 TRINITY_DN14768_c0_g1_i2:188-769(+)
MKSEFNMKKLDVAEMRKYLYCHKDSKHIFKEIKKSFIKSSTKPSTQRTTAKFNEKSHSPLPKDTIVQPLFKNEEGSSLDEMLGSSSRRSEAGTQTEYTIPQAVQEILDGESTAELASKLHRLPTTKRGIKHFAERFVMLYLRNVPNIDAKKWKLLYGYVEEFIPVGFKTSYEVTIGQVILRKQLPLTHLYWIC